MVLFCYRAQNSLFFDVSMWYIKLAEVLSSESLCLLKREEFMTHLLVDHGFLLLIPLL